MQDAAAADTQPLKVSCQFTRAGYIPASSTCCSIAFPHHSHINLPAQEEMCRYCPMQGLCFQPIFWDRSSRCVYIQVLWALGILLPIAGRFRLILPISVLLVKLAASRREVSWQAYSWNADSSILKGYSWW